MSSDTPTVYTALFMKFSETAFFFFSSRTWVHIWMYCSCTYVMGCICKIFSQENNETPYPSRETLSVLFLPQKVQIIWRRLMFSLNSRVKCPLSTNRLWITTTALPMAWLERFPLPLPFGVPVRFSVCGLCSDTIAQAACNLLLGQDFKWLQCVWGAPPSTWRPSPWVAPWKSVYLCWMHGVWQHVPSQAVPTVYQMSGWKECG